MKLFREEVDGHLQLLMLKNSFSGLHTWSQTSLIVNINPLFVFLKTTGTILIICRKLEVNHLKRFQDMSKNIHAKK